MKSKRIAAFIFARGGSRGLPNKNLMEVGGVSLLCRAITAAKTSKAVDEVFISTDSEQIAEKAAEYGATIPFLRPRNLATDDSPEIESWRHAVNYIQTRAGWELEALVSVPTTCPFREHVDIDRCIAEYYATQADLVVTITGSARNPYFNMLRKRELFLELVCPPGEKEISRRQDCPAIFDVTTSCYVAKPHYILKTETLFAGKIAGVKVAKDRSIDIDTQFDLDLANGLHYQRSKL